MNTTFVPNPTVCSIIDIRWQDQYATGHIAGSINIPSDRILSYIERLKEMRKPIVLCCQSGFRSRQAARILLLNGVKDVIDGGDYRVLSRKYDLPIEVI